MIDNGIKAIPPTPQVKNNKPTRIRAEGKPAGFSYPSENDVILFYREWQMGSYSFM